MFTFVHNSFSASSAHLYQESLSNISPSDIIQRTKDVAFAMFSRFSDFLKDFNQESNESNLKVFALISCVSLIALLVISMLRCRDSRIVYPTTPQNNG